MTLGDFIEHLESELDKDQLSSFLDYIDIFYNFKDVSTELPIRAAVDLAFDNHRADSKFKMAIRGILNLKPESVKGKGIQKNISKLTKISEASKVKKLTESLKKRIQKEI